MLDPVPWAIGGGAENGIEAARAAVYAATSGAEGVVSPGDLKIWAQPVPSGSVYMEWGSALILNRSDGGQQQTYTVRNAYGGDTETLAIPPTSAAARNYLVGIRVEDPQYSPWQPFTDPDDILHGKINHLRLIGPVGQASSVGDLDPSVWNQSFLPLARIEIPPNTAAITNAMIKDLRHVAMPRRQEEVVMISPDNLQQGPANDGPRGWFPMADPLVFCPWWATYVDIEVTIGNLLLVGDYFGGVRAEYGWNGTTQVSLNTQDAGLHHQGPGTSERTTVVIAERLFIPDEFRNKAHHVRLGTRPEAVSTGYAQAETWTNIVHKLTFHGLAA